MNEHGEGVEAYLDLRPQAGQFLEHTGHASSPRGRIFKRLQEGPWELSVRPDDRYLPVHLTFVIVGGETHRLEVVVPARPSPRRSGATSSP